MNQLLSYLIGRNLRLVPATKEGMIVVGVLAAILVILVVFAWWDSHR